MSLSLTVQLTFLLDGCFAVGKRKMLDEETAALFTSSSPPSGRDLFLGLLAYVLPSAAFFSMDTGIWNSLLVSLVGF
jgi:hypothetical protein